MVTGHQRSREYDGPFRYLTMDFAGPMQPQSDRGHKYMFTTTCPWSGWYWAFPCEDDTSETAANMLLYRVMCDIAGYPLRISKAAAAARPQAHDEGLAKLNVKAADFKAKQLAGEPRLADQAG